MKRARNARLITTVSLPVQSVSIGFRNLGFVCSVYEYVRDVLSRPEGTSQGVHVLILAVQTALTKGRRPGCLSGSVEPDTGLLEWQQALAARVAA